jgi:glycerol uptake facilitator-like aquaporin
VTDARGGRASTHGLRDERGEDPYLPAPWNPRFDAGLVEARRLFAELLGTFFLVLTGAGSAVVGARTATDMGRAAQVAAPGLMVMAIILSMGRVSGAHLNPAVTIGFTARGDFPWRRVPGYIAAQMVGAVLACLFLAEVLGRIGMVGATEPGSGISDLQAFSFELVLTVGLMSVILGTASSAQSVGPLAALAVGGYIALAGLWSSPVTGASMNPRAPSRQTWFCGTSRTTWCTSPAPSRVRWSQSPSPMPCVDPVATRAAAARPKATTRPRRPHNIGSSRNDPTTTPACSADSRGPGRPRYAQHPRLARMREAKGSVSRCRCRVPSWRCLAASPRSREPVWRGR